MELIIVIVILILFFSFFSLAPFLPTRSKDLNRILEISKLKPWEKFLEVWCWTARVATYIAKEMPENEVVWIELSPFFYVYSKIKSLFFWTKNLKIIYWNALNLNFWDYDVIYVFWLWDSIEKKIFPKMEKEAKWKRLLSYCFNPESKVAKQIKYKKDNTELSIFEYNF